MDHVAVGSQRNGARGRPEPGKGFRSQESADAPNHDRTSQELGLSPAAISAHLSRLKVAGLAEPHRSGKKVYYRLSFAGESLLEIFGETD